jgi:hypothetical protein
LYSGGSPGHVNGPVTDALFSTPNGIVANATFDTIYVSEYNTKRLRMITGFTVGINELQDDLAITLSPNPTSEVLNLTVSAIDLSYSVRIIDLQGKVIYEMQNIDDSSLQLDVSAFEAGTHQFGIESANSKMSVNRIIKLD